MPGYDVKILRVDGSECEPGEEGAICIQLPLPPGTLPTLWGDDARYEASYLCEHPGYYLTGDGGFIDEDGYLFVMGLLAWAFHAEHAFDVFQELEIVFRDVGLVLLFSAITWTMYLAIEPYVRRRWPHTLISWTRLLSGRVQDPLIGRDVLIGVAAGAVMALAIALFRRLPAAVGGPATAPAAHRLLASAAMRKRPLAAGMAACIAGAMCYGLLKLLATGAAAGEMLPMYSSVVQAQRVDAPVSAALQHRTMVPTVAIAIETAIDATPDPVTLFLTGVVLLGAAEGLRRVW